MNSEQDLNKPQSQQLNIAGVSKRYIELKRDDLRKDKNNLLIEEITLYDFKGSIMSRDEMCKAEQIIFVDGEQIKELKNKYATW
jgi:SHS2 domain-containing protein